MGLLILDIFLLSGPKRNGLKLTGQLEDEAKRPCKIKQEVSKTENMMLNMINTRKPSHWFQ